MPLMAAQLYLVGIAILIFETAPMKTTIIRTQRVLYLRRFSTLSFSCFVFGYALSQPIRNVLGMCDGKLDIFMFMVYEFALFSTQLLVHCLLDLMEDRMTPDWIIKSFGAIFAIGKDKKPLSDQHLNVYPINLFSKEL